jgi:hypothetical protein
MKRIDIGQTYADGDITTVGYRIQVAKTERDGWAVVLTKRSRWQGSRDGDESWITKQYENYDQSEATERAEELLADPERIDWTLQQDGPNAAETVRSRRVGCTVQ